MGNGRIDSPIGRRDQGGRSASAVTVISTSLVIYGILQVGICNAQNIIGCLPCSHQFLTSSYFHNHSSLLDSEFHDFLVKSIDSSSLCKGLHYNSDEIIISDLNRLLIGEGSHRQLVSKLRFTLHLDALKRLDARFCEAIIVERLPNGVFADPFELQHLVERRAFLAADVFGDTNLELPSALSNRSIVEVHSAIACDAETNRCEAVVRLPLHARYPPLNSNGYVEVVIGRPDIFLRCRPEEVQNETCSWGVRNLDSVTKSVVWRIPCGNEAHTGIVSSVTFVSALLCSLAIVFSAIRFSTNDDAKRF